MSYFGKLGTDPDVCVRHFDTSRVRVRSGIDRRDRLTEYLERSLLFREPMADVITLVWKEMRAESPAIAGNVIPMSAQLSVLKSRGMPLHTPIPWPTNVAPRRLHC